MSSHTVEEIMRKLESLSGVQLESVAHYVNILEKAFSHPKGPDGMVIHEFMRTHRVVLDERRTEIKLPIRWEMLNDKGIIHGGVLATLVDNAMGGTLHLLNPDIKRSVTIDMNIRYLATVTGTELIARTELVRAGKSLCVLACMVYDDRNEPVVQASGTFRVYRN